MDYRSRHENIRFMKAAMIGLLLCPVNAVAADDIEFQVAPGFAIETILREPDVQQPLCMNFDERGRLWVVQYRQYPFPAGLKNIGHDEYWRIQYENFPPPAPPNHVRGMDKITIFDDRDGDGAFEHQKDFVTGLNICTSALPGRGGVWVLNPPYLLFYPDRNRDDVPDGDPEVHLAGFGLEDLHAVANGLRWGPDGWLYGYQGSTTTATIVRPGLDTEGLRFEGQNLWRYNTDDRRFELFDEGGHNNFGLALDAKGRFFTGGNGGVIGFHHVQGGYYWKNWGKHGNLTNPYAFGYFDAMEDHSSRAKLSQGMVSYEATQFPDSFQHMLITARALQRRVSVARLEARGSTFAAYELDEQLVATEDENFRPVDMTIGPDGALYIADWHDTNITWSVSAEHERVMRETGRIYRVTHGAHVPHKPFDMGSVSNAELLDYLQHPGKWYRQTALRVLYDRKDRALIPALLDALETAEPQAALEFCWALHASDGLDSTPAMMLLGHSDPHLRAWTIRLLGDRGDVGDPVAEQLERMATDEGTPSVRSQLASTARRLPARSGLPIVSAMLGAEKDVDDPHIPLLLWWAVECAIRNDREAALRWLDTEIVRGSTIFREVILPRVGRRFSIDNRPEDFEACVVLLAATTNPEDRTRLIKGMTTGFGRAKRIDVPSSLLNAVKHLVEENPGDAELSILSARLGDAAMLAQATQSIADNSVTNREKLPLIALLGQKEYAPAKSVLIELFLQSEDNGVRSAALEALANFHGSDVGATFLQAVREDHPLKSRLVSLLVSRQAWARDLLAAVDSGDLSASDIDRTLLINLTALQDPNIDSIVRKHWGVIQRSSDETLARVNGVYAIVKNGPGNASAGRLQFEERCAKCHELHGVGRGIGPVLTGTERRNLWDLVTEVIDPNRSVLPEYAGAIFTLRDNDADALELHARTITGFLVRDTGRETTILDSSGAETTVLNENIESMRPMTLSIMPEGLLDDMSDHDLRDLFSFLQADASP